MFKLIRKNLWVRRGRNGWLLAELILVTILTWYIADPVFVLTYNRSLPLGYDPNGLLIASLNHLPEGAAGYNAEEADSLSITQNIDRIMQKLRAYPEVQNASMLTTYAYPGSNGSANTRLKYDTLNYTLEIYYFLPHSNFFQTFGFETLDNKSLKSLDDMDFSDEDIVVTADVATKVGSDVSLVGKSFYEIEDASDTVYYPVKGMVGEVRARTFEQAVPAMFMAQNDMSIDDLKDTGALLIRLKPGTSEQRFLHDFRPWAQKNLRAGNQYVREVKPYNEKLAKLEYSYGVTNKYRMNVALAFFFLVNLALGVTGTFWLQTRSRKEEVGIMLSYGASRGHIKRLLMGEAAVLATLAWLIGCFIYLQYGIANGAWFQQGNLGFGHWINNFWIHYVVVSLLIYVIILFVVLLGVYIPAYKISSISPTDALRDE